MSRRGRAGARRGRAGRFFGFDPGQPLQPGGQPPIPVAKDVPDGREQGEPDQERV